MKRKYLAIAALPFALMACDSAKTGSTNPSNPVLTSIAEETDCAKLQAAFDQAADNGHNIAGAHELGLEYMKAADDRMKVAGCYGD